MFPFYKSDNAVSWKRRMEVCYRAKMHLQVNYEDPVMRLVDAKNEADWTRFKAFQK